MVQKLFVQTKVDLDQSGYAALFSVIIITAIAITFSSSLLVTGSTNQRTSSDLYNSTRARVNAESCVEMAIRELVINNAFAGSYSQILDPGSCTYEVVQQSSGAVLVNATGISGIMKTKLQVELNVLSGIKVNRWQEIQ